MDSNLLNQAFREQNDAEIRDSLGGGKTEIRQVVIDLGTARLESNPMEIFGAFRSFFISDATDTSSNLYMRLDTRETFTPAIKLTKNDSMEFTRMKTGAFLHWAAQSGKTLTITFFFSSIFRSGKQISQNSGGVTINEGSIVSAITSVNLVAATAAAIVPTNLDRKTATIQNKTGASIFLSGDSAVTDDTTPATAGIELASGAVYEWRNTAALYAYSLAGGRVNYFEET